MPNSTPNPRPHAQIGNRLRAWREAAELRPVDVVKASEGRFQPHGWSQWESGKARLSLDNALLLVDRYRGVTLDYIYRGKYEGLSHELYEKIRPKLLRIAEEDTVDTRAVAVTTRKKRAK